MICMDDTMFSLLIGWVQWAGRERWF